MSKRTNTRALRAFQFFVEKGWRPHQASAIVGNFMQESGRGLSTTALGDNGTAYGISQWRGPRQRGLRELAHERGTKVSDFETQLEFAQWELENTEKGAGRKLKSARDMQSANDAMLDFLRPQGWKPGNATRAHGRRNRLNYSNEVFGLAEGRPDIIQAAEQNVRGRRMSELSAETRAQMQNMAQTGSPNKGEGIVDAAQARMAGSEEMAAADAQQQSFDTGEWPEMQFSDIGFEADQPFQNYMEGVDAVPEPPEPPGEGGKGTPKFQLPPDVPIEVDLFEEDPNARIPFLKMQEMALSGPLGGLPPLPDPVPLSRRERMQRG